MQKLVLFVFAFSVSIGKAQHNDSQAAVYNIATNAIAGGLGAVINKKPNEKFHKVLLKGMGQGALGGYVVFESKRLLRNLSRTDNYAYVWPSKLLNSAGNSIVYNAASNRNFWERWHLDFGFNYLEYDLKREKKFRYRILPAALFGTVEGFVSGNLDVQRTLYTGHFIFQQKKPSSKFHGIAIANTIRYHPIYLRSTAALMTHEIIHAYQYNGYFWFNSFFDKPTNKLADKSKFMKTYNKIFLNEFNYLFMGTITGAERLYGTLEIDTMHENEAYYYQYGSRPNRF